MNTMIRSLIASLLLAIPVAQASAQTASQPQSEYRDTLFQPITQAIGQFLKPIAAATGVLRIIDAEIDEQKKIITLTYSTTLAEYPFRSDRVETIYTMAAQLLPDPYRSYQLRILSGGKEISQWVPKFYREALRTEKQSRKNSGSVSTPPLKTSISQPFQIEQGLQNRHIALWQSHGFYYAQNLDRWEWQRPRLFQTVEDLFTQSYILPFLVPMLESAGAVVFMPRERDTQVNEVIVDNDMPQTRYFELTGTNRWQTPSDHGFAHTKPTYNDGENPFRMGTYRQVQAITLSKNSIEKPSYAVWQPNIPQSGRYAVYVSYKSLPNSATDALYTVYHKGGQTVFKINQTMGGGTWIYLGHFEFDQGIAEHGKVELTNTSSSKNKVITADGVKFGGGMGNIARSPSDNQDPNRQSVLPLLSSGLPGQPAVSRLQYPPMISTYPRYTEGSRYWLQWAGAPDSVYTPNQSRNDYNDDYMSRGRWVNYLSGSSSVNRKQEGLGIPLDLSLAFHTDAGVTLTDSIVGTLGIYTSMSEGSNLLADGRSRFISRDLTDLVQTQIVSDIRATFEPKWMRRGIWDRSYAESRSPNIPAMLLELLSHQNFADMRYGLDPNFKFTVSRAIYKGMLRFLSSMDGAPYIVQPLPIEQFSLTFASDTHALLKWQPVEDPLEPTANADSYVVYTRIDDGSFDNGILVKTNSLQIPIEAGRHYSFRITAVNKGGESFPSEILSLYRALNERGKVLIVNGFDKTSAPHSFASKDSLYGGFLDAREYGIAYLQEISYIGSQYDIRRKNPWTANDSPGFGASYSTYETQVLAGNSFDYPIVHGRAFAIESYSYASCSQKAFMHDSTLTAGYQIVDLILGKQRQTITGTGHSGVRYTAFPSVLQTRLTDYCHSGGNVLVSGAYVASDIWDSGITPVDSVARRFATNVLKYRWVTGHASQVGEVKPALSPFTRLFNNNYRFYTQPNPVSYWVEAPDALSPSSPDSFTIFSYVDGNKSAGVAYPGNDYKTVVLGFPIESIIDASERNTLIKNILLFFNL
ncbi:MAG: N-acetylmuramoyl-L-alanine amidase [Bacteroidales bacterium]|nr:N-acetylmuramoyl-L-alanine amidase [Bacteroidales bacterium]